MTVRMVRTEEVNAPVEAPEAPAPALRVIAPEPLPLQRVEPPEKETVQQSLSDRALVNAVGVMTALAEIISIRFTLILALVGAFILTAFGEHTVLSTVNAAAFDVLVVVPLIALTLRKG